MEIRPNQPPKGDIPRNFVETFELTDGLSKQLSKHVPSPGTLMPIENEYAPNFSSRVTETTSILSQNYLNI